MSAYTNLHCSHHMFAGHAIALHFKLAKNHEAAKYAFTQAAHGQTKLSAYPFSNAHFEVLIYLMVLSC